jgi:hypothetical protein
VGVTLEDVKAAYEEQCEFVEGERGRVILMASRALAAVAKTPEDYAEVYGSILAQVSNPVILHWLGDAFDPRSKGTGAIATSTTPWGCASPSSETTPRRWTA